MHCLDARMRLRDLPLSTTLQNEAHVETLNHYATCAQCRPLGIAQIKRTKMLCVDAVTTCLRGDGMFHDEMRCETLQDLFAHEHIFGTTLHNSCEHEVCSTMRSFWNDQNGVVPNEEKLASAVNDVIKTAECKCWPIEPLLQALRDRRLVLENKARSAHRAIAHFYRLEMMHIDETLANYD